MTTPRILRCRAAIIHRIVTVATTGPVAVVLALNLTANGIDGALGVVLLAAALLTAYLCVVSALELPAHVVIRDDGVDLVGAFTTRSLAWNDIRGFETEFSRGAYVLWIINAERSHLAVDAFGGPYNYFHPRQGPPSFRAAAAELESEWRRRRG